MKICFKMNEILDFNLHCKFQSVWTCFGNIIRKTENRFPSPLFFMKCMLSLWHQQYFAASQKPFPQKLWNFCYMVFIEIGAGTEMLKQGCQDKRKQIETMLLRYQPSITCNPQTALKSTFDFTEIVNEWTWNRGTVCHFVRFISQLS